MTEQSIILNRVSTNEQDPGLQLKDCKEYNEQKGWTCLKVFEKNVSAYKHEDVWKTEIDWAIKNKVQHVIVWNIDRYSREPEDIVIDRVKMLSLMHDLQIHAVHGDAWSEMLETVSKLKTMGFIGTALVEFLEKIVRGLEHQRAHRESQVKSERVKAALRQEKGKTVSYKGNVWGRPEKNINIYEVGKLKSEGLTIRQIASSMSVPKSRVEKALKELSRKGLLEKKHSFINKTTTN